MNECYTLPKAECSCPTLPTHQQARGSDVERTMAVLTSAEELTNTHTHITMAQSVRGAPLVIVYPGMYNAPEARLNLFHKVLTTAGIVLAGVYVIRTSILIGRGEGQSVDNAL
jgi:hypothetical protein